MCRGPWQRCTADARGADPIGVMPDVMAEHKPRDRACLHVQGGLNAGLAVLVHADHLGDGLVGKVKLGLKRCKRGERPALAGGGSRRWQLHAPARSSLRKYCLRGGAWA
jgi:hypothetical protein